MALPLLAAIRPLLRLLWLLHLLLLGACADFTVWLLLMMMLVLLLRLL
jgi:hypothetical protein